MNDETERLEVAQELVLRAGTRAQELRRAGLSRAQKAHQDFVTQADNEIEATVRVKLLERFRSDGFLGEESGMVPAPTDDGGVWILDPVDGTSNYAAGLDAWCISLAWVHGGQARLGIVYAPDRNELFIARRGEGATLNQAPLSLLDAVPVPIDQSLIMTGQGSALPMEAHLEVLRRLLSAGFEYRRFGSGALGIARVATGTIQGYVEPGMYPWDVAAARLVVSEAGGELAPFPIDRLSTELGPPVVACRPGLHDTLVATVQLD